MGSAPASPEPDGGDPGVVHHPDEGHSHDCPACGRTVERVHRPGRHRIYCTNACRQKAYRWRLANGVRRCVERDGPARMLCNDRLHADRDPRDPAARLHDRRNRDLTACGVFAVRLRNGHRTHDRFVPESPSSCSACIALIGVGPYGTGIPDCVRRYWVDPRGSTAPLLGGPVTAGRASFARFVADQHVEGTGDTC